MRRDLAVLTNAKRLSGVIKDAGDRRNQDELLIGAEDPTRNIPSIQQTPRSGFAQLERMCSFVRQSFR